DDEVVLLVLQAVHDGWAHEAAAVGNGADRHRHLQRRDGEPLAHRNLGDGNFVPVFHRVHEAARFARKRNTRRVAKTKAANVLINPRRAEYHADLGRADVRRLHNDIFDGQIAEMMPRVVQDVTGEGEAPFFAVEDVVERYHALVQGGRNDNRLERRAGLIRVGDDSIAQVRHGRVLSGTVRVER